MSGQHDTALFADEPDTWPRATPLPEVSDQEARAAGSRGRQAEIFTLVYRQMRSLVGGRAEFDDLVQIAAEQALRGLSSFEGRSKISTWTYRICYLTLLKHERWYRRWLRRFALTEPGELSETEATLAPDDFVLEQLERSARLRKAVEQLSPKRRAVVVLHDLSMAARHCSRVVLFSDGRITADGAPTDVLSSDNLHKTFGVDAFIGEHGGAPVILPLRRRA